MELNDWLTILGALGGLEAIKWIVNFYVNRKTDARKEDAAADAAEITPDMENADISAAMSEAMLSVELDGLTGKAKWTEDGECDKEPKAFEIQDGAYVEMD